MNEIPFDDIRIPGIKKQKDGRFMIDLVRSIKGKRIHVRSSNFLTIQDALDAMPLLIEARTAKAREKEGEQIKFCEFLAKYERYRLLHVRKSTMALTKCVVKKHFKDWMQLHVNEVFCYAKMRDTYDAILSSEGTSSWKNRCFGTLRLMTEAAYKWKYITSEAHRDCLSILENIPENRGAKIEKQIWSNKEKQRFFSAIEDEDDKMLFALFITLGARIGEFMGLTWDCFDERKGTIEIKQQLIYQNTGKWVLSNELKTRESYRVCKLSPSIVSMLKAYKAKGKGEGFLFRSAINQDEPLSKGSFRKKMNDYTKKANVKRVTPHAIRHGKATELMRVCKNMAEVKAAARYLGHSATMMIDTYGHSERSATDAVLKRLEKDEDVFFGFVPKEN